MTESYRFIERWVEALVRMNPNQMTCDEYMYVVKLIRECQPCDVLVFGVGYDSPLWHICNPEGRTVFLEHDLDWIERVRKTYAAFKINVVQVVYSTTVREHSHETDEEVLLLNGLPEGNWKIILVDAPPGYNDDDPGRMQSIYSAWALDSTHVVIHDCDRPVEDWHAQRWFGSSAQSGIGSLRHFYKEEKCAN